MNSPSQWPKKWQPNAAQREILESLFAEADNKQKYASDAEFCRIHSAAFSASQWSKIRRVFDDSAPDSYFDNISDPDDKMEVLEVMWNEIRASRRRQIFKGKLCKTSFLVALKQALREAKNQETAERLVVGLAPTRGGKTTACEYLAKEISAKVVNGRQAWRSAKRGAGYLCFLKDVASAVGCRLKGESRSEVIERILIDFFNQRTIPLLIDEGEYFGSEVLDGIKLFLNESRVVVGIFAIPGAYDNWNRYFPHQSSQLAGRTLCVVEQLVVNPSDAALFFPENQFASPDDALETIAKSASSFGAFSLIKRVATRLQGSLNCDQKNVESAVARARAEMKGVGK